MWNKPNTEINPHKISMSFNARKEICYELFFTGCLLKSRHCCWKNGVISQIGLGFCACCTIRFLERSFPFMPVPAKQADKHSRLLVYCKNLVWFDGTCFLPSLPFQPFSRFSHCSRRQLNGLNNTAGIPELQQELPGFGIMDSNFQNGEFSF